MKRVKLADLAREAGVSPATVTRALNRSGYVSADKRERVEDAARRLGYVPNYAARALKSSRSCLVGHIVPSGYHNPYFSLLGEEVNRAALERGYHVITLVISNVERELTGLMEQLKARGVDGIILSSFMQAEMTPQLVAYLENFPIPLVMVERSAECFGFDKVQINNAEGTFLATRYLQEMGHFEIAYFGKKPVFSVEQERLHGFLLAMQWEKRDVLPKDRVFLAEEYTAEEGYRLARQLTQSEKFPTGLLIASDLLASGAVDFFLSHGIRIPQQLSVIGHDDTLAPFFMPPLTSVSLPVRELASCALDLVLDREAGGRGGKTITVSPYLKERASVARRNPDG